MKVPLSCRGPSTRRTVEGILDDHQTFLSAGGDLKKAKQFNNCMSEPFFKIPISQVHVHFSKQPKEYVNVLFTAYNRSVCQVSTSLRGSSRKSSHF